MHIETEQEPTPSNDNSKHVPHVDLSIFYFNSLSLLSEISVYISICSTNVIGKTERN
jgi:hypothetical protein